MRSSSLVKSLVRAVSAFVIILVVGVVGLSAFFSDFSPGESLLQRVIVTLGAYVVGGIALGWLLRRYWYLAVAEAWGPALIACAVMLAAVRMGLDWGRISNIILGLVVAPVLSLAAGFVGSRFCSRAVTYEQAS